MKKQFLLILTSLLAIAKASAQDCCYTNSGTDCFGFEAVLLYDIGGGYRQDYINWKTYPVSDPGTVIQEQWKKLQIGIVETNAQFLVCDHYLARLDFDYGWFQDGGNQTVSHHNIDMHELTEKLKSETRGRVYNIDGSVGYQFNFCDYRYAITPLVGYSYHFQKLKNDNYRNQLVNAKLPNSKEKFKNNYTYRWRGPTLGFITAYQIDPYWQVNFMYTYHWVRFRGKIIESFVERSLTGFQKSNRGYGNEFTLGTTYEFCPDWLLGLKVDYKLFYGHGGSYKTEQVVGLFTDDKVVSPLRDLRWTSVNATIDVMYIF